jgi:hypothetical protein
VKSEGRSALVLRQFAILALAVQIGALPQVAAAQSLKPKQRPAELVVQAVPQGFSPSVALTPGPAKTIVFTLPPDKSRRNVSVVVREGLRSMALVPTPELKLHRKAMQEGREIPDYALRSLAELWDGMAALRLVRKLAEEGEAARPADIAWYGTIAVSTGRIWPLEDTIAAMHKLDPATVPVDRLQAFSEMLLAHAWAGNSLALDAVIDHSGPGRLLGPMSAEVLARILERDAANGDGRIALRLAIALWQNADSPAAANATLQEYLDRAISGNNLVVRTTALNLSAQIKEKRLEQAPTQ